MKVVWCVLLVSQCLIVAMAITGPTKLNTCGDITSPGSYVLSKNIDAFGNCFVIRTSGVTLDLDGHAILGDGTGTAIVNNLSWRAITVRNGNILHFECAVDLLLSQGVAVQDLNIFDMQSDGVLVGNSSRVIGNTLEGIQGTGVRTSARSVITRNAIWALEEGITEAGGSSVIADNAVTAFGSAVILAGPGTLVSNNTLQNASAAGIIGGAGVTVRGNQIGFATEGVNVVCPSNVIDNTFVGPAAGTAVVTAGAGCNVANNAP